MSILISRKYTRDLLELSDKRDRVIIRNAWQSYEMCFNKSNKNNQLYFEYEGLRLRTAESNDSAIFRNELTT